MSLQASAIMLGVKDVDRAKTFYVDGMGCAIDQDFGYFSDPDGYPWKVTTAT